MSRFGGVIPCVHRQAVGNEEQVKFPAFGDARDLLHDLQAAAACGVAFVAPAGGMVAGSEDEDAEVHLTFGRGHIAYVPFTMRLSPRRRLGCGMRDRRDALLGFWGLMLQHGPRNAPPY